MAVKPLKVVEFKPERADPEVVDALADLLDLAKSGHLRGFVMVTTELLETGAAGTAILDAGVMDSIRFLGKISMLEAKVRRDFLEHLESDE